MRRALRATTCLVGLAAAIAGCTRGPAVGSVTGTAAANEERTPTPGELARKEPDAAAKKLFAQKCAGCHTGARRQAPLLGPGYNSRTWIKGFLLDPGGDAYFGRTKISGMKPVKLRGIELAAIVELVYAQTGANDVDTSLAARGKTLFEQGSCANCHSLDRTSTGNQGPNLGKRGSVEMLTEFLAEPSRWFGSKSQMPRFGVKLDTSQRRALARWLRRQAALP